MAQAESAQQLRLFRRLELFLASQPRPELFRAPGGQWRVGCPYLQGGYRSLFQTCRVVAERRA